MIAAIKTYLPIYYYSIEKQQDIKSLFTATFIVIDLFSIAQNVVTGNKSLQQLLTYYYNLKNALVKDDVDKASASAQELLNTSKNINVKTLTTTEQKAFGSAREAIEHNADHISGTTNLEHQREHFEDLPHAMIKLVQSVLLLQQPVYLDYCPMKKTYRLSSGKAIQNPYYGQKMPGCGSVEKTLMPGKEHSMQMKDDMQMNSSTSINDTMPIDNLQHNMNNMQMSDSEMSHKSDMDMTMPM